MWIIAITFSRNCWFRWSSRGLAPLDLVWISLATGELLLVNILRVDSKDSTRAPQNFEGCLAMGPDQSWTRPAKHAKHVAAHVGGREKRGWSCLLQAIQTLQTEGVLEKVRNIIAQNFIKIQYFISRRARASTKLHVSVLNGWWRVGFNCDALERFWCGFFNVKWSYSLTYLMKIKLISWKYEWNIWNNFMNHPFKNF